MTPHTDCRNKRTDSLPPERVYELLADADRIAILDVLDAAGGTLEIDDLIDRVTMRDGPVGQDEHERTRTRLHHAHIPKLVNAGVIIRRQDLVRLTGRARPLLAQLRAGRGDPEQSPLA